MIDKKISDGLVQDSQTPSNVTIIEKIEEVVARHPDYAKRRLDFRRKCLLCGSSYWVEQKIEPSVFEMIARWCLKFVPTPVLKALS